jgi:hypothetical protein
MISSQSRHSAALRGQPVFVDQFAEQVAAADPVDTDHVAAGLVCRRGYAEWCPLLECAVWPGSL